MNWYTAKLLADDYATARQLQASKHRQARAAAHPAGRAEPRDERRGAGRSWRHLGARLSWWPRSPGAATEVTPC